MIAHNVVGWFEIPVQDMDRAVKFYESVFDLKLERHQMGPLDMAWFPGVPESIGASGSLVHSPGNYEASDKGVLIYFTAFSGDLSIELSRVEKAGGKVLRQKTQIAPDVGYMGLFLDSEGNRIAVHHR